MTKIDQDNLAFRKIFKLLRVLVWSQGLVGGTPILLTGRWWYYQFCWPFSLLSRMLFANMYCNLGGWYNTDYQA
jgi:hypothetical protein